MPLTFDVVDGIGVFRSVGDVEYEEGFAVFTAGLETIAARPEGDRRLLFDLVESHESRSAEELRALASLARERLGSGRMALVARSELLYGLSRMFGSLVEGDGFDVAVFHERADATAWLGRGRR